MLTRTCLDCGRLNTAVKVLTPSEQHYVNMKCKYSNNKIFGSLDVPKETNPYNPTTHVPGVVGLSYNQLVAKDGATHYWRLDDVNVSANGPVLDSIGGLNSQSNGGPVFGQPGIQNNNCALFSANAAVTLNALALYPQITLEVWIKKTVDVGGVDRIFESPTFEFGSNTGIIWCSLGFTDATATGWVITNITIPNNNWIGAVMTWDGTWLRVYKNGVEGFASNTWAGKTLQTAPTLRAIGSGSSSGLAGYIDEVALYPKVLTPAQILAHYNAGK